jgi:hypothetical protein
MMDDKRQSGKKPKGAWTKKDRSEPRDRGYDGFQRFSSSSSTNNRGSSNDISKKTNDDL